MKHKYTLAFEIDDEERYPCLKCPMDQGGECLLNDEIDYTSSYDDQYAECPLKGGAPFVYTYSYKPKDDRDPWEDEQ